MVVKAVAAGKEAAESMHRYINGWDMTAYRPVTFPENPQYPPIPEMKAEKRAVAPEISVAQRKSFDEIELAFPDHR